ncbi:hypothetical protein AB0C59_03160 [Streptomyces sp. NPDC048664]|uniref:hypothetical protein n=1 Tax=Streptomyces sp. NPDC048664 TaxID=3154505 RepID=UPI00341B8B53
MSVIVFNVTTAALLILMFKGALALIGEDALRRPPIPWVAVALTAVAVGGMVLQHSWAGAMDALDDDPRRSGWWRVVTSVFLQNGGVLGAAWNIVTLAVVAACAQRFWRGPLTVALFAAGILLPERVDALFGDTGHSTDPRNFAGSSGATYFLAATLAGALLLCAPAVKDRLLALSVPVAGLAMWLAQDNGHGLVAVYGFVLGVVVLPLARRLPRTAVPAASRAPLGDAPPNTPDTV